MLPSKIIAIPNADKGFHETWSPNDDLLNFCHPFRFLAFSAPNGGKSTNILNTIIRQEPPFTKLYVVHCDPETKEYDNIEAEILKEIPALEEFDPKEKNCVIIDDVDLKSLDKDQKYRLSRLFGYSSTHRNISVFLATQNPISVPCEVRRCSNVVVFGRIADLECTRRLGAKFGIRSKTFDRMYKKLVDPHDSLWIDMTKGTPAPYRLNGYNILDINNFED